MTCRTCGRNEEAGATFWRRSSSHLHSVCSDCRRAENKSACRDWYARNRERKLAYERDRRSAQ